MPARRHRIYQRYGSRGRAQFRSARTACAGQCRRLGCALQDHRYCRTNSRSKHASHGMPSGYELVDIPRLPGLSRLGSCNQHYARHSAQSRRTELSNVSGWHQPLMLHLDSQYHQFQFTVNFGFPSRTATRRRPALQAAVGLSADAGFSALYREACTGGPGRALSGTFRLTIALYILENDHRRHSATTPVSRRWIEAAGDRSLSSQLDHRRRLSHTGR